MALRNYARQRGFTIVFPSSADECMRFYEGIDVHVGSRLHAHLLFLSKNKRSYLVPVDDRSAGIADHFGFPLWSVEDLDRNWDCDFEIVRSRARDTYGVMERFVKSLGDRGDRPHNDTREAGVNDVWMHSEKTLLR